MTEVLFARLDEMTAAVANLQAQITAIVPIDNANIIALSNLDATGGILTQTAAATFLKRTLTGTTAEITVTNGTGVSGNPTLSLPTALTFTGKTITGGSFSSPSFVTPALGTPASGTLTNTTGFPTANLAGAGTGVLAALAINIGSAGAPVLFGGALGTPSSGIGTNLTGTAAGLTAGTVTTNANLTGVITSSGNATSIASQTGTGTKFVVDTSPTIITPSFTTSATVTGGNFTDPNGNVYSNLPQNSKSAAYTTVLADRNTHILHPTADNNARTFTIDSNANVAYPIGTTLTFINQINTVTIAITSDTLVLTGLGSTGSRTLAANGMATAVKVTSTIWFINGVGLT